MPRPRSRRRLRRASRRRRLPEPGPQQEGGPEEREGAYALALKALSYKERTQAELEGWLRERDVGEAELAEAIERLTEAGALDDEHFALRYAEDKRELAGWGPDRIREALANRGIASELIEAVVASEDGAQQVRRAEGLLADRGAEVDTDQGRARALALLARRGYPLEVAYEAVRAYERAA